MFLTKSNLIISFCLFTFFISAKEEYVKPRFSKIGEKYYVHVLIDNDELEITTCEVFSGSYKSNALYSKSAPFNIKNSRMGNELIIDVTDIPKDNLYEYFIKVSTNYLCDRFISYKFAFDIEADSFILKDSSYEAMYASDSDKIGILNKTYLY